MKKNNYILGVILIMGITIGVYFISINKEKSKKVTIVSVATSTTESEDAHFQLINPTITANLGKHYIINFAPLKDTLVNIQKKYGEKTYVYFLYLNNGVWVGLNEREVFKAASMLKVPLAMSVFKMVEDKKINLDTTYILEEKDMDNRFGELYKEGPGGVHSLKELVRIMLEQSDNTAMHAIDTLLNRYGIADPLSDVYTAFGWQYLEPPAINEAYNYADINLKTLANMFLALYNSTYLTPEHSEQILLYLSQTPFNEKILEGVPNDVTVSHKIGIGGDTNTFSDCGIVYVPNQNYVACMGTSELSEQKANEFMKETSSAIYNYVINN